MSGTQREEGTVRQRIIDRVGHIESLDYDDFESRVNQREDMKMAKSARKNLDVARWFFTILIGITTGIMGYMSETHMSLQKSNNAHLLPHFLQHI